MDSVKAEGLDVVEKRTFTMPSASYDLFAEGSSTPVLNAVSSGTQPPSPNVERAATDPAECATRYHQAVNVEAVLKLKDISTHHSACIQAKKYATVGLGFVDQGDEVTKASTEMEAMEMAASLLNGQAYVRSKVDDVLDPMTHFGFQHELTNAVEDFEDTGTGYLGVVRDTSGTIVRVEHVSVADVWPETQGANLYYYYRNPQSGSDKYFALFGQKDWLFEEGPYKGSGQSREQISELIPFLEPSNRARFQGYPEWISGSTDIDLLKKSKQYKADFYHNRGVLDYIIHLAGTVDPNQWSTLEATIKKSAGEGNNFGNVLIGTDQDSTLTVHRMAPDMKTEDQFAKDNETLTQNIVSAHRVPPLLANILIPGKLGATNEFINALVGFQLLVIGPRQNIFQSGLARTLGSDGGVEGLDDDDFRLRTITSQIDIAGMDTIGRMRSEATSGENADRDMSDGVKD